MSEVVRNTLVKLQAIIALIGLAAITPLLILVALLGRLIAKLCWCSAPKSIAGEVAVVSLGQIDEINKISYKLGCRKRISYMIVEKSVNRINFRQCMDVFCNISNVLLFLLKVSANYELQL